MLIFFESHRVEEKSLYSRIKKTYEKSVIVWLIEIELMTKGSSGSFYCPNIYRGFYFKFQLTLVEI